MPKHFFYSVQTFKGPVSSQALNSLLQGQVHGPTTAPITVSVSTSMVIPNGTVINHDTYMPFYSCIKYDIHCTYIIMWSPCVCLYINPVCICTYTNCGNFLMIVIKSCSFVFTGFSWEGLGAQGSTPFQCGTWSSSKKNWDWKVYLGHICVLAEYNLHLLTAHLPNMSSSFVLGNCTGIFGKI